MSTCTDSWVELALWVVLALLAGSTTAVALLMLRGGQADEEHDAEADHE